ncbi:methyltransferase domain-containing protein [Solirubrobacter ginsenosidimutans]|uniref:Methyltransferase domain-containing protein n=2 Tax=Solirubrobacter ginsenosidimutans TaxID=490573 RepID=A0A9X3S667_9ACTN|nr:methyltransferase domain-containing protein [Solirubrobacter ginsenosidimutans]
MRAYYEKRAAEYDDWWLGAGRFEERERPGWYEDMSALIDMVLALTPARTLDLACGTGFLTRHLPGEVSGVDQSPSMIEIAAARRKDGAFEVGDALAPRPGFERIFSSHFYGHLDADQREAFLALPRDELVIVDSALRPESVAEDWQERVLDDGSTHSVYKRWFTAAGLLDEIGGGEVLHDGPWFVAVRSSIPRF